MNTIKFTTSTTANGWIRVETRFQTIGTFKTKAAAEVAMRKEQERVDFILERTAPAFKIGTYEAIMSAQIAAEQAWKAHTRG